MSEFPPLRGDKDGLTRSSTPVLDRRLARVVNTSAANREDAIAFAWTVFLRRQPDRDGPRKAYLLTIARNEAIALDRRDRDHDTLTCVSERDRAVRSDTDRAHPERPVADPRGRHTQRLELSDAVAQWPSCLRARGESRSCAPTVCRGGRSRSSPGSRAASSV